MMHVDQVTAAGSANQSGFNASWQLISANSEQGLRYRQRFTLALPTAGIAEELLLAPTTGLKLKARNMIFNALQSSAPEQAQLSQADSQSVRLSLPQARVIHSIRFTSSTLAAGKSTQLFRVDGDVVSEDPFTSYLNPVLALLSFQDKPVMAKSGTLAKGGVATGLVNQQPGQSQGESLGIIAIDNIPGGSLGGELGVVDRELIIRLSGTNPFSVNQLSQINLSTGPENLRINLRLPALMAEAIPLPLTFPLNQLVDCGGALRDQLADLLRRLQEKLIAEASAAGVPLLPNPLLFELDIESDAPCLFDISGFAIDYQLVRNSFPTGEPKQVLRFAGDRLERQRLPFAMPAGCTLVTGELHINGNPLQDAAASVADAGTTTPGTLEAAADNQGLRTDARHGWASPLDLNDARLIRGLDLLISPLQSGVQLQLELVSEVNELPDGERLLLADGKLGVAGSARWQRFTAKQNLLLQPGRYWLILISREGAAVWHTQPISGSRILRAHNDEEGALAENRAGIASWVAADGPASAQAEVPEIRLNDQPLTAVAVERELVYDLLPGMASVTGPAGTLLTQQLEILSSGPKTLTLYPPRVVFEQ